MDTRPQTVDNVLSACHTIIHSGREVMNHIAGGLVIILSILSMNGAARAEEGAKTAAGVKMSINRWKSERPGSESRTSTISTLVGWAVEANMSDDVFVEASYLVSVSDYNFDQTDVASDLERNDFDMAVGHQFKHNVAVFAGYRSTQFRERVTQDKETVHGPLVGVLGAVPVNNALSIFGRLTCLPWSTKKTVAATTEKETALGWLARAGIKYVFTSQIAGALGYQYETTKGKDTRITDTFAGATLDVMYSF